MDRSGDDEKGRGRGRWRFCFYFEKNNSNNNKWINLKLVTSSGRSRLAFFLFGLFIEIWATYLSLSLFLVRMILRLRQD